MVKKPNNIRTLGASNHSSYDRELNDYYATEPKAVRLLLSLETFDGDIWECACGEGHLSKEVESLGYKVLSSDLIDRGFGKQFNFVIGDVNKFLDENGMTKKINIITNPPYKIAQEFIERALNIIDDGYKIALFLPIRYLESKSRRALFTKYPIKTVYVSSSRIICAINGDFKSVTSSAVTYAWFIWQKGYKGETILKWFN
jgi:hypothetical protein